MSGAGEPDKAHLAAANNADLCASLYRAHGLRSARDDRLLLCLDRPPPFYPKVVTLRADTCVEVELDGGAIKDSFASLDAKSLDLNVLFEAFWIWRNRQSSPMPNGWARMDTANNLAAWQSAWRGKGAPQAGDTFPDACLNDADLMFLGRSDSGQVTAGCLANISAHVVGISNVFSTRRETDCFAVAAQAVCALGHDKPVVGYENADLLSQATRAGFAPVGPLRVLVPPR